MSYSIMYNWQFLKSEEGLTPVVLMGDNNVTTSVWMGNHWGERCARDWSCLFNFIGVNEDEFMAAIQNMTGKSYQEHWMRNGKWVDDKSLVNWAKNACKNAATIEEVKEENWNVTIQACLAVWENYNRSTMLVEYIKDTKSLDTWIRKAKVIVAEQKAAGHSVYPIIKYDNEKLTRHSAKTVHKPAFVVVKSAHGYLVGVEEERVREGIASSYWNRSIKKALVLSYDVAADFKKQYQHGNVRLIDAKAKDAPYDAVIRAVPRSGNGTCCYYVSSVSGTTTRFVSTITGAKRYRDMRSAETSAAKLNGRGFKYDYCAVQIFSLTEEDNCNG